MRLPALILIFAILCPVSLPAQDISAQSEAKRVAEEEIRFINTQLEALSSKQKASTQQLLMIQRKISAGKSLLKSLDAQIRENENRCIAAQREVNRLQKNLDTLEAYYRKLIYNTYRNRDTKVWFLYVLSGDNIGQGYRRFTYLKNLSGEVSRQGFKIKETKSRIERERANLLAMQESVRSARAEREKEYNSLVREETASRKTLKNLSKSESQYRTELAARKKEVDRLNKEIARILNQTVSQQKQDNTQIDYALAGRFGQNKGLLPWPVRRGTITERFGKHTHPVYKNLKLPDSNGITFTTEKDAEAFCVFDGVVRQIVVMPGYNQCVLVQHGTYFTFYCRLAKVSVKSGQTVSRGDAIGTLEAETPTSSSLHFQIWNGTERQNPEDWLARH